PPPPASARVASEVGTPTTLRPARTFSPKSSTKCLAVEPVPSPSLMPSCTCSRACAAACRFSSSIVTRKPAREKVAFVYRPLAVGNSGDQAQPPDFPLRYYLVHRGLDGGKPVFHHFTHFRMRENVELVVADRSENASGYLGGVKPRLDAPCEFGNQRGRGACGIERLRLAVAAGTIAAALAYCGAHKVRTQHADADAARLKLKRKS